MHLSVYVLCAAAGLAQIELNPSRTTNKRKVRRNEALFGVYVRRSLALVNQINNTLVGIADVSCRGRREEYIFSPAHQTLTSRGTTRSRRIQTIAAARNGAMTLPWRSDW
jgi:hypothetical protein